MKGNQENSERTKHGCWCLIPGSDDAWYRANVLLIYQPRNRSERGLLRGAIEAWRCSASLLRALCGETENVRSPASRAAFILEKTRTFSQSAPFSGLHLETQSGFISLAGDGCFVLLTCVLFDLGGSLIDDGVNSGPPGWAGRGAPEQTTLFVP